MSADKLAVARNRSGHCSDRLFHFRQIHRHDLRDTGLDHGDTVHDVGGGHGALVVRDDDELRVLGELTDDVVELVDVGVVERRVHFVKDAERGRLQQVEAEQERGRGEGLFSSRQLGDRQGALAFRFEIGRAHV